MLIVSLFRVGSWLPRCSIRFAMAFGLRMSGGGPQHKSEQMGTLVYGVGSVNADTTMHVPCP